MPLVATEGTPLVGPGTGVVGVPPLVTVPGRPKIDGVDVALEGDLVEFTYSDERGPQILTLTSLLSSLVCRSSGRAWALEGTLTSDPEVQVGRPIQTLVRAI
jgi:hypothetical protein